MKDPETVIENTHFFAEPQAGHHRLADMDRLFQFVLECRITDYLRGIGHLAHPDLKGLISEEEYVANIGDKNTRARTFLRAVSSSVMVPLDLFITVSNV